LPCIRENRNINYRVSSKTLNGTLSHQETNPNPCFQALENGDVLQHFCYNHKPTKRLTVAEKDIAALSKSEIQLTTIQNNGLEEV
jgi:hypothetical protein